VWNTSGVRLALTTLPRLAEVVNCASAHVLVNVGGTLFATGHDAPDAPLAGGVPVADGITAAGNGFDTAPVVRFTRTGRNRLALTTACGALFALSHALGDSTPWSWRAVRMRCAPWNR